MGLENYVTEGHCCKRGVLREIVVDAQNEYHKDQQRPTPEKSTVFDKRGLMSARPDPANDGKLDDSHDRKYDQHLKIQKGAVQKEGLKRLEERYISEYDLKARKVAGLDEHPKERHKREGIYPTEGA